MIEEVGERPPLIVAHLMGRLSATGGVQMVVRRLAEGVDPSKLTLHVVTMRPAWDDLSDLPARIHAGGFGGSRYRLRDRVAIVARMAREVRRIQPEVVHLHSGMAWLGFVALFTSPRVPFVIEVHDAPSSGRHAPSTDRLEGLLIRSGRVSAVCHSTQTEIELIQRSRIPAKSIARFPLGVDTGRFRPRSAEERAIWRNHHGIAADVVVAIAVGRPAPLKRYDLLIEAVAGARSHGVRLELVLVGTGEDELLRSVAISNGVSEVVHMSGIVDDLALAIASCDVLCSTSEYEGFGLTIAEGMACGLPVVATAVGGVPDVVLDCITGYLVTAGDSDEFAARLRELSESPSTRARLGAEGRARAEERFTIQGMAESFHDLYRSLASRRHRKRSLWRGSST